MRGLFPGASCFAALLLSHCVADASFETIHSTRKILPTNFRPPAVFENVNLVRNINLEKGYPRETVNVVIRNIGSKSEDEYYLPFEASTIARVGCLEVWDKNNADKGTFTVETVEYDPYSSTQFYLIHLPRPLAPKAEQTLSITFNTLSDLIPLPAKIDQSDQQYVSHTFSAYHPSAYSTLKQKTKVKFPTDTIPDYTILPANSEIKSENKQDPQRQGRTFTYGPFAAVPAGIAEQASVRYEYTHPLMHVTLLERDIEVSQWGGNLATEDRYWLVNRAAALKVPFNRVKWQQQQYFNPPTSAFRGLGIPLQPGSTDAYFVDDIGNVSTSKFRSGDLMKNQGGALELRPRYPIFGDWKYKFKIGWNRDLQGSLRKTKSGEGYVLRVPFFEAPKTVEGMEFEKVVLRIILPEGASNIKYETSVPTLETSLSLHRTFMDTKGRTCLTLTAMNLVDEIWDPVVVVTYDYPAAAGLRKPFTILTAVFSIFTIAWLLGMADVSIAAKKA